MARDLFFQNISAIEMFFMSITDEIFKSGLN